MPSSSQFLGVFPIRPVCVAATTNALLNSSSSTYGNVAFLNELVCREGKDRVEKKQNNKSSHLFSFFSFLSFFLFDFPPIEFEHDQG